MFKSQNKSLKHIPWTLRKNVFDVAEVESKIYDDAELDLTTASQL